MEFAAGQDTAMRLGLPPTREQELDFLKDEAQALRRTLEGIDVRIKELTGEGK